MSTAARVPLWRDPALVALTVTATLVLGAFVLDMGSPRARTVACWVLTPLLDLLEFGMCRRVWRTLPLRPYARRFWQAVGAASLIFCAGDTTQLVAVLADPAVDRLTFHPVQSVAALLGVLVGGIAALLPQGAANRSLRQHLRMLLDTAIVSTASGVVAWCLMTRPGLTTAGPSAYFVALFGCGLVLCGVFVAVRSGLSGVAPMSGPAAAPLVAALLVQAAGSILLPSGAVGGTGAQLAITIAPCLVVLAAPRIQLLTGPPALNGRPWWSSRRWFSLVPYTGTLVCAATLVIVLVTEGLGVPAWGALAGLLVNVGLVVGRQVLALSENNELLIRIRDREQRLNALLRRSSEIISIATPQGVLTYVSPAVERLLGLPVDGVLGSGALDMHLDDRERLAGDLAVLYSTPGAELTWQGRYRHADGSWRWLEVIAVNLTREPGLGGVVCNSRDVTESRELHERLWYQAGHDEMTGLANRRRFTAEMTARTGDTTVLLIDLDGFKQINDAYGHATGDAVLRHVAGLLRDCSGPDDVPARLGGDEFAVLAGSDRASAEQVAARLRAALAEPAEIAGRELAVGASIGLATGSPADPDHLLHAADLRMYEEKQRSRTYSS